MSHSLLEYIIALCFKFAVDNDKADFSISPAVLIIVYYVSIIIILMTVDIAA